MQIICKCVQGKMFIYVLVINTSGMSNMLVTSIHMHGLLPTDGWQMLYTMQY